MTVTGTVTRAGPGPARLRHDSMAHLCHGRSAQDVPCHGLGLLIVAGLLVPAPRARAAALPYHCGKLGKALQSHSVTRPGPGLPPAIMIDCWRAAIIPASHDQWAGPPATR